MVVFLSLRVNSFGNSYFVALSRGGVFYTNEYNFSFDMYATKLLRGYAVMERYRNAVAPETKVERLLAGINVASAPIIVNAKEHIEDHLLGD